MQAPNPAIFTPTATNLPTLSLASHLIGSSGGRHGTSQQLARSRPSALPATISSTPYSAPPSTPPSAPPSASPSVPPIEQRIVFIGALAVAKWPTDRNNK